VTSPGPRYLLYGLTVEAGRPLPGLRPAPGSAAPDVRLHVGAHPAGFAASALDARPWYASDRPAATADPTLVVHRTTDGGWLHLAYADGTEFSVSADGRRVGCTWPAALTLEDTATYLLGPVMGLVLRLRGVTCLHASAISIDGAALLVCGPAGAGKSTTAAAFAGRGRPVLADDVAALEEDADDGVIRVRAAYPHLRLWPDAVRALYGEGASLPPLTPNWDKRFLDLGDAEAFHAESLPVLAVYLLAGRETEDAPRVEPLPPSQAVLSLVANTYMGWLPDLGAAARDLALYGRLVRRGAAVRLVPHADAARLGELCALVEADFRARLEAGEGAGRG
jgi:hypothetical protein